MRAGLNIGIPNSHGHRSPPPYGAHRYWRLDISATSGGNTNSVIAELKLYEVDGGPNIATGKTYGASTASSPGTDQTHAFDGDPATFWSSQVGGLPSWISVDLGVGNAAAVSLFSVTANNGSGLAAPKTMALKYSDNNIAWTQAFAPPDSTGWIAGETRKFNYA